MDVAGPAVVVTFFQELPDAVLVEDVELAGHDQHPLRREAFDVLVEELAQGRAWLAQFDHCGHNVKAFDALLEMLWNV